MSETEQMFTCCGCERTLPEKGNLAGGLKSVNAPDVDKYMICMGCAEVVDDLAQAAQVVAIVKVHDAVKEESPTYAQAFRDAHVEALREFWRAQQEQS